MRSRKSGLENAPTREGKPNSPDESVSTTNHTRRKLIARIGLGATLLAIGGQAYAFLRSLVPNVLYENPQRFKIGTIDQFSEGAKFIDYKRIFIFREKNTFHCISATCTHLGCTVRAEALANPKSADVGGSPMTLTHRFLCPCHGSQYTGDGINVAGPAPRPLAWYRLSFAPDDGQLVVDLADEVRHDFRLRRA